MTPAEQADAWNARARADEHFNPRDAMIERDKQSWLDQLRAGAPGATEENILSGWEDVKRNLSYDPYQGQRSDLGVKDPRDVIGHVLGKLNYGLSNEPNSNPPSNYGYQQGTYEAPPGPGATGPGVTQSSSAMLEPGGTGPDTFMFESPLGYPSVPSTAQPGTASASSYDARYQSYLNGLIQQVMAQLQAGR